MVRKAQLTLRSLLLFVVSASLLMITSPADAAPPSNDACAGAIELPFGVAVTGSTRKANNDYTAENAKPPPDPDLTLVPSAGPDVVYHVTLPAQTHAMVTVLAKYRVSVYAAINAPSLNVDDPCGKATLSKSSGQQVSFASQGGSMILLAGTSPSDVVGYWLVVDGWTAKDKGGFTIAISTLPLVSTSTIISDYNPAIR